MRSSLDDLRSELTGGIRIVETDIHKRDAGREVH